MRVSTTADRPAGPRGPGPGLGRVRARRTWRLRGPLLPTSPPPAWFCVCFPGPHSALQNETKQKDVGEKLREKTDELQFSSGWRGWCVLARSLARSGPGGPLCGGDAAREASAEAGGREETPRSPRSRLRTGARTNGKPGPRPGANQDAPSELGPAKHTLARSGSKLEGRWARDDGTQSRVGISPWTRTNGPGAPRRALACPAGLL